MKSSALPSLPAALLMVACLMVTCDVPKPVAQGVVTDAQADDLRDGMTKAAVLSEVGRPKRVMEDRGYDRELHFYVMTQGPQRFVLGRDTYIEEGKRTMVLAYVGGRLTALPRAEGSRPETLAETQFRTYCAMCHGFGGTGDGPLAEQMPVKAKDWTNQEWQRLVTDEWLLRVIRDGGPSVGLDKVMVANPVYRSSKKVLNELVGIVRSKAKKK